MTSNTFKSAYPGRSNQSLGIVRADNRVRVSVDHGSDGARGIIIAPSDAPALALAILEAAGVVPVQRDYESYDDGTPAHLQAVAYFLKQHNEAQERATAEARERAELEAEALELANAAVIECGNPPYPSVERMGEKVLRRWLAVALRAREMRAEK